MFSRHDSGIHVFHLTQDSNFQKYQTIPLTWSSQSAVLFSECFVSALSFFSRSFQTRGLSIFCCWAFPASAQALTSLRLEKPQSYDWTDCNSADSQSHYWGKTGEELLSSLPWGTVLNHHWSRTEQLLCLTFNKNHEISVFRWLLPPTGGLCSHSAAAASQQVFFKTSPGWTPSTDCSVVYRMQFYCWKDELVCVSNVE